MNVEEQMLISVVTDELAYSLFLFICPEFATIFWPYFS